MPQSKPLALVIMLGSAIDLIVGIVLAAATDLLIPGVVCIFSAGVLFFVGLAFMPGGRRSSDSSTQDSGGSSHSDWDSTD